VDILNEIEDVYFDLDIKANPKKYLTATSISTGTNPTTITTLYNIDVAGGGVFDANSDGTITDTLMTRTNRGASSTGYWVEDQVSEGGSKIHFTPTAIGTATKWVVFVPFRTVLVDGATTLFPSRKAHFIKRALLRYFYLWKQNPLVNMMDAEFQNHLRQIIGNSTSAAEDASLELSSF
jgi:hypothetical protein